MVKFYSVKLDESTFKKLKRAKITFLEHNPSIKDTHTNIINKALTYYVDD